MADGDLGYVTVSGELGSDLGLDVEAGHMEVEVSYRIGLQHVHAV
jgi:hypothetical protein